MWAAITGAFALGTLLFCVPQGVVGVVGELPECCHSWTVLWIPGMGKAELQEQNLCSKASLKLV